MNTQESVILFTRFPQPGKVKTRLIERLGPQGAADLQKQMTEQVIRRIQPTLHARSIQLQIYYCGGSCQEMSDWLGHENNLYRQQGDDLGRRMKHALSRTIRQGAERVLLIGSDCPAIDAHIISSGLEQLAGHDLVLGPAMDGGYYLIGLRAGSKEYAGLFTGIDWGTDQVLLQTTAEADRKRLSHALLPRLHDIDGPEDLVYFNHHTCP